jgi:hypothetical protein
VLNLITNVLTFISSLTFLILIVGGLFSSLYFLERITAVFSEEGLNMLLILDLL